jgi:hemerythrin superfamily protein
MPVRNTSRKQDAIALLKKDHVKVRGLLKKLENSRGGDARLNLLQQIDTELKTHTTIEEEIFYPAFKSAARSKDQKKLYFEAIEEHHVVDLVLPEMMTSSIAADVFAAKAKVLKELVEHHADEEETEMFPKARKILGAERLRELGGKIQVRKDQLAAGMWDRSLRVLNPFAVRKPRKRAA